MMLVHVADLQNVNITLRILFRPQVPVLPKIYTNLGVDYDERVLPSITNEVLKAVVVGTFRSLFRYIRSFFYGDNVMSALGWHLICF